MNVYTDEGVLCRAHSCSWNDVRCSFIHVVLSPIKVYESAVSGAESQRGLAAGRS